MKRYLFVFGYEAPGDRTANERFAPDQESSSAVWIPAASEEEALQRGRAYAEEFVARLHDATETETAPSWSAGNFAHWISPDPLQEFSGPALESLPVLETLNENAPQWFLFPWFREQGGQHVHPDDLAIVLQSHPYGHVMEPLGVSDGWHRLRYSGGIIRVRPALLHPVPPPPFRYDDTVSTVPPRSPVTGTIREILWHHGAAAYLFYLTAFGERFKTRYRAHELTPSQA